MKYRNCCGIWWGFGLLEPIKTTANKLVGPNPSRVALGILFFLLFNICGVRHIAPIPLLDNGLNSNFTQCNTGTVPVSSALLFVFLSLKTDVKFSCKKLISKKNFEKRLIFCLHLVSH
jgi:hypothetical protein